MAPRLATFIGAIQLLVLAACSGYESKDDIPNVKVTSDADTAYARHLHEQAVALSDEARCDSALVIFERANNIYRAARAWSESISGYAAEARCAIDTGKFEEARSILNKALKFGTEQLGVTDPALSDILSELGWLEMKESNYGAAIERHREALVLRIVAFGDRSGSVADTYNRLALAHYFSGDYERAEALYTVARDIRVELDQPIYIAAIHNNLAVLYRDQGQYARAASLLHNSLTLSRPAIGNDHPEVSLTLKNLGETERLRGNYREAFEAHHEALRIAKRTYGVTHPTVANILNDLAIVHTNTGHPEKAIPFYKRSLSIIQAQYGDQHLSVTSRLSGLGVAHLELGDYELALQYLLRALAIRQAKFGENDRSVGIYLNNIGEVHARKGNLEQARVYYQRALSSFIVSLGEKHPYVANQYKKLGGIMNRLGMHDAARTFLNRAVHIFRATSGEKDPYVAAVYSSLGSVYDSLGSTSRALAYHLRALKHLSEIHGEHHPAVTAEYNNIGEIYERHGAPERALTSFLQAIRSNQSEIIDPTSPRDTTAKEVLSNTEFLASLWGKARVLETRATHGANRIQDLKIAHDTYLEAARSLDRMQRRYRSQNDRLHWVEVAAPLMADAVQVSYDLYQATGDDAYKAAAFYFAEKSKGSVLLGALSDAKARRFAGIPDSLLRQERSLLASLVSTEQRLLNVRTSAEMSASTDLQRLEQEAFAYTQQHSALIEHFEKSYPNYFKLKYNVQVATPDRVQAAGLNPDTALIEYMIGDEQIFIFTLTTSDFDVTAVPRTPGLERRVEDLRHGIVEQKYGTYTENARALYVQLIEPVIDDLEVGNILVVPDGVLNYVPFESLLTETPSDSSSGNYRSLPYLINRYAVSYAYSSTLLLETRSRERTEPDRDFVAFAPVAIDGLEAGSPGADMVEKYAGAGVSKPARWGYLPMTRVEVTKIKELFSGTYSLVERLFSNRAQVYLGKSAREWRVMSDDIRRYRYVHFATHGFADPASPESSGIVLFSTAVAAEDESLLLDSGETEWSEDGVLRLHEVYALSLNADVVVLSACDTGVGPVARGEGILSLARGFLYAGASNVVASLWKADDLQTQRLMLGFYENMLDGSATSASMRAAKLDLIRGSSRYAQPYYWATFVLIGV